MRVYTSFVKQNVEYVYIPQTFISVGKFLFVITFSDLVPS
jgi:hypothetical protein